MRANFVLFSLTASFWLAACQPAITPASQARQAHAAGQPAATMRDERASETDHAPNLPNTLVFAEGRVEVRRLNSLKYVPVALGAELEPGDVIHIAQGQAGIFCGAERDWETSPLTIAAGKTTGITCGAGRPPRPYADTSAVRAAGGESEVEMDVGLVILSPRSGVVRGDRPPLAWTEAVGATSYTVTLESDDGISRVTVADSSPLPYPAGWEALEGDGASYRLVVQAGDMRSDDTTPGFSLLERQADFQSKFDRLAQRPLDEPARTLLMAELYLSHNLRSEAVALLNTAPEANRVMAIQNLLGETYLNMGLVAQSQAAYARMLELAQAGEFVESQGKALLGLGLASCILRDENAAQQHWTQARQLYEENEATRDIQIVDAWLSALQAKCN